MTDASRDALVAAAADVAVAVVASRARGPAARGRECVGPWGHSRFARRRRPRTGWGRRPGSSARAARPREEKDGDVDAAAGIAAGAGGQRGDALGDHERAWRCSRGSESMHAQRGFGERTSGSRRCPRTRSAGRGRGTGRSSARQALGVGERARARTLDEEAGAAGADLGSARRWPGRRRPSAASSGARVGWRRGERARRRAGAVRVAAGDAERDGGEHGGNGQRRARHRRGSGAAATPLPVARNAATKGSAGAAASVANGPCCTTRPSRISTTTSARCAASPTSWVTTMTVLPSDRKMPRRSSRSSARTSGSSADSGSSSSSTSGSSSSARMIATRCTWPPDSSFG